MTIILNDGFGKPVPVGETVTVFDATKNYKIGDVVDVADQYRVRVGRARCVRRYADEPKWTSSVYSDPRRSESLPQINFGEDHYDFEIIEEV